MQLTDPARSLVIPLLMLVYAQAGFGIDAEWELQRDRDGVEVYTGTVPGSKHKAVRSITLVKGHVAQLVAVIRDTANCHELSDLCKESYEHEVINETELFVYSLNDLPWPVSDRDAVTHVIWSMEPSSRTVTMVATIVADKIPPQKKIVRLTQGVTKWVFKPLENGQVEVVSEAHIDPEGGVPAWITNVLLVDSPFETMVNFRNLVESGRHQSASFDFLSGAE